MNVLTLHLLLLFFLLLGFFIARDFYNRKINLYKISYNEEHIGYIASRSKETAISRLMKCKYKKNILKGNLNISCIVSDITSLEIFTEENIKKGI